MSNGGYGLALLKIKWPDLRARLDCGFLYSSDLRDLVTAYGEAVSYCEKLAREVGPGPDLKEYELLCDELEVDIRRTLMIIGPPSRGP
jgi:hypothetical protein